MQVPSPLPSTSHGAHAGAPARPPSASISLQRLGLQLPPTQCSLGLAQSALVTQGSSHSFWVFTSRNGESPGSSTQRAGQAQSASPLQAFKGSKPPSTEQSSSPVVVPPLPPLLV